jgi:hypothetical protein
MMAALGHDGLAGVAKGHASMCRGWSMVTVDDVRAVALPLPRTVEVLVRDRIKFRVGRIVYAAFSRDETLMGFGFPKVERAALVAAEPERFVLPSASDMRYNWVVVRLDAIDVAHMRELVLDAWTMVVPKKVSREYFLTTAPQRPAARPEGRT